MKILFLTRRTWPYVGGVERHIKEVKMVLEEKGHSVKVISEDDIKYPRIKFFGLLFIWLWFFRNRKSIKKTNVIHIHDVFIWYLPFRFLFAPKRVYMTFHGWEEKWPIPLFNIFQKRIAAKLSNANIAIGEYVEKYYGIRTDKISYGGTVLTGGSVIKKEETILYVGRLDENTGLLKFLAWLKKNPKYKVDFCGDGNLRSECEKYGTVHGFTDPVPFYKKAEVCVPGGYLAALEGLSYNCKLKLFWNNKIKEDYWKMSPFYKLKGRELSNWARKQTWEKLANEYLALYHSSK